MNSFRYLPSVSGVAAVLCALLASVTLRSPVQADEPFVQWAITSSNCSVSAICPAPGGGVLSALSISVNGTAALLRFDNAGRLAASNAIPFSNAYEIQTDSTGAIYCAGIDGPNDDTFSVAKLSPDGTLVWRNDASDPLPGFYHRADALAINATGSVYAIGISQGPVTLGGFEFGDGNGLLLCRFDQGGQAVWVRRILDAGVGSTHSMDVDPSGNILFSGWLPPGEMDFLGTTVDPGATHNYDYGDAYIAKCDPNGNLLWVNVGNLHLGDLPGGTMGMCSAVDSLGNTYFLEGAQWLGKLDASGNLLWSKTFPGAFLRQSLGIAIAADDEPVFCGQINGTVSFDTIQLRSRTSDVQGFFLAKSDTNGNIRWAISGGSSAYDVPFRVACDTAGNIFLGATIETAGAFDGIPLTSKPNQLGITSLLAKISETPLMRIAYTADAANLAWPAKATNYILEATTSLPAISWDQLTNNPTVSGRARTLQLPLTGAVRFFRLRKP